MGEFFHLVMGGVLLRITKYSGPEYYFFQICTSSIYLIYFVSLHKTRSIFLPSSDNMSEGERGGVVEGEADTRRDAN